MQNKFTKEILADVRGVLKLSACVMGGGCVSVKEGVSMCGRYLYLIHQTTQQQSRSHLMSHDIY